MPVPAPSSVDDFARMLTTTYFIADGNSSAEALECLARVTRTAAVTCNINEHVLVGKNKDFCPTITRSWDGWRSGLTGRDGPLGRQGHPSRERVRQAGNQEVWSHKGAHPFEAAVSLSRIAHDVWHILHCRPSRDVDVRAVRSLVWQEDVHDKSQLRIAMQPCARSFMWRTRRCSRSVARRASSTSGRSSCPNTKGSISSS